MKRELVRAVRQPFVITWLYVAVALVLGWVVPRLKGGTLAFVNPDLGPDQVIAFLSAVSSGMMAFTGIVFALMFIVLQFGSTAYSPQLVPLLTRHPTLSHAGGVFTGTFLYSLMALRGVGAIGGRTTALTVWTAFAWLIASVYLLTRLVGVFRSLEVTNVLDIVSSMAHREIDRLYGPYTAEAAAPEPHETVGAGVVQRLVHRGATRYLIGLDVTRLVAIARDSNAVIRVGFAVGDAITAGTCLASVEGSARPIPEEALRAAIVLGPDRTGEQGPKHAMRMLVDIAIRALSPAINDPTTAVHALDQLEGLLRRIGESNLDIGTLRDPSGALRLVYPTATWEEYLELAVTEIQQYGADAVQVERRLAALFSLLRDNVPEARRDAIERFSREHLAVVRGAFPEGSPRGRAERLDRQGLGHTSLHS